MSYQPANLESRRIMTETIKTLLQPIQNRLNAATPGPWSHGRGITPYVAKRDWVEVQNQATICHDVRPADADFIANAPTDQARLLAAVQAVVAEIADTDLETNEAQQGDLSDRILAAIESALTEAS